MKYLKNLSKKEIFGKICLLRADLNISEKKAENSPRILGILPTIKFLINNGAKVVLLSHRGRPEPAKQVNLKFSIRPFARILSKLLGKPIKFIDFSKNWKEIAAVINSNNSIFLLENLRFLLGEEKNGLKLAKQLASLGDFYINDAFSSSHRKNASICAITKFLPSYAGLLLEKEIKNLSLVMKSRKYPLIVVLGGAKISDKIGLIKNFLDKADYFLIGGGIANNFLLAKGLPIGDSIYEESTVDFAKKMLNNKKVLLPVDYKIENRKILDIGLNTVKMYSNIIKKAKTIIWNGPMGYFENPKFAKGSEEIAKAIISNKKAFSVIGGGETSAIFQIAKIKNLKSLLPKAISRQGLIKNNNLFISTGGGAMLEYLAGKKLPGIESLK